MMNLHTIVLILTPIIVSLIIFWFGYNEGYKDGVNHMEENYINRKYEREDNKQNDQSRS